MNKKRSNWNINISNEAEGAFAYLSVPDSYISISSIFHKIMNISTHKIIYVCALVSVRVNACVPAAPNIIKHRNERGDFARVSRQHIQQLYILRIMVNEYNNDTKIHMCVNGYKNKHVDKTHKPQSHKHNHNQNIHNRMLTVKLIIT